MNRRTFLNWWGLGWLVSAAPTLIATLMTITHTQLIATATPTPIFFYVAPNGNDTWTGKQPTRSGKNGPFATIARARAAIGQLKQRQGGKLRQPVTVLLRGGTYFLTDTLEFTAADSGTKDFPIVYRAYQQEQPVISGGQILKGWQQFQLNGKTVWAIDRATQQPEGWLFHQLWVNDRRAQRCRYPKQGYLKVDTGLDITPTTPFEQGQNRFKFRDRDLKAWQDLDRGEAIVMTNWVESRLPLTAIDPVNRIVTCQYPTLYRIEPGNADSSGAGIYYLENIREFLTEPGEWYLDTKSGRVYYLPMPGEQIARSTIIAPRLTKLVNLGGDPKTGKFVEYLSFENLTFAHAEWYYAPTESKRSLGQAAIGNCPGAISADRVRFCSWKQCTVAHISNYAIDFASDCVDNQVRGCEFFDLGSGAIKIQQSSGHQIIGCHIYNGGLIFHSAVAIWIGIAANNLVAHNHIHDFYYSGISVGWLWSKKPTIAANNIIEFNHIHHLGQRTDGSPPLLNDKGAIYTLGRQPGTKIRSNLIHDIQSYNYGGWGIYLDEGSSQMLVENNIVYNTRDGSFHLHIGEDNLVQNNIFAFGNRSQLQRTIEVALPVGSLPSFSLIDNIIYWREGQLLSGNWADPYYECDRNFYWDSRALAIGFDKFSWREWQQTGKDRHSTITDPLFVDPAQGNFRLQPNSPALKMGFKSLDYVYDLARRSSKL